MWAVPIYSYVEKKHKVIFIYKLNNPNICIQKQYLVDETFENINRIALLLLYTHKHVSEYGSYYGSNYKMNLLYETNTLHISLPFWSSGFNVKTNLMFQSSFFPFFFSNRRKDDKDNGMVVAEVGLPCGFKADLSKTNAIGLDHKETSSDKVVLYFKNVRFVHLLITVYNNRN